MSSEAITQNDLREILSRVAGSVPSEYRKLLWTNLSPTSAFNAQTIINNIDLSKYDVIEIEVFERDSTQTVGKITTSREIKVPLSGSVTSTIQVPATNVFAYRNFTITPTSISCATAYWRPNYNGSGDNANAGLVVPAYIYGIKYERVAPPQVEYPNYSTEEQQVGTWATGKPLYRKVFQYASMPNNTTATYAHNISNMDIVVRYTCCWWDSNDGRFIIGPRVDSSAIMIVCAINKTNIILQAIGTNWATRTSNVNVIVEYTKTTD